MNPEKIRLNELPFVPLDQRIELPEKPCIYFVLTPEEEILYIGRSRNLRLRWLSHHRLPDLKKIEGVRVAYLHIDQPSLLPQIEQAMIEWFNPRLNKTSVATAKQKRLSLKGFSDFHYKWGKLWSFAKNRPLSKLIVDVFEARIEANKSEIEMMMRDIAEQRGITYEELVDQIMNGESDDDDDK